MGRAADAFDGIVAAGLPRNPDDWRNRLLARRAELGDDEFDLEVRAAIREHLFDDFEDPGDDPDLGEAIG